MMMMLQRDFRGRERRGGVRKRERKVLTGVGVGVDHCFFHRGFAQGQTTPVVWFRWREEVGSQQTFELQVSRIVK